MNIFIVRMFLLTADGSDCYEHTAIDGSKYLDRGRTWGWYANYEDAERAVMKNYTDMWECDYNFAVIEEVPEGACPFSEVRQWFNCERDIVYEPNVRPNRIDLRIEKCDPPVYADGLCNLTIG